MVFKILCILIFWVKVALALEGLRASLVVEAMLHHIIVNLFQHLRKYIRTSNSLGFDWLVMGTPASASVTIYSIVLLEYVLTDTLTKLE